MSSAISPPRTSASPFALPDSQAQLFDTIIVSHVLEHVPQPVKFLADLARYLKPDGRLFVDVPDVCAYHWLADLHIAHIFHFSARTLIGAANAAGLGVVEIRHHHPPKLPACVSVVLAHGGPNAAPPDDIAQLEAQAVDRIRRFDRRAWLFNKCFRLIMFSYETGWNILAPVLPDKKPQ
jgi:SAM-dependent methyltransferase